MLNKIEKAWQNWIKTAFEFKAINNNEVQVLTPFTDTFGDGILFNVRQDGNNYTLTDNGYLLWNLEINGIDVNKLQVSIDKILKQFGVTRTNNDEILRKNVKMGKLPQAMMDFVELILQLSYLSR